ncbi:transcription factor bHLH63-like isoform X2 [Ananas comosus]|uniref:Transcription factor bHLH63-like isoform X2 n=2 Tax=Ananas comosus TaxID=4615 RepID=A0A6P5FMH4_ANACO|nr:transcription factor bHLH63-like isoform X2 [Ananas comosus]CAD1842815.1 unnamed protein product [Ananas comosus var. bracteatus]
MAQCIPTRASTNPSVLERQRVRLNWQQQQSTDNTDCIGYNNIESFAPLSSFDQLPKNFVDGERSRNESFGHVHDPIESLGDGWPDFSMVNYPNFCAINVGEKANDKENSDSSKKRKFGNFSNSQVDANNATENSGSSKGMKEDYVLGERKGATGNQKPQNKKETSTETLKENGKASRSSTTTTPLKTDYIHVRARRGQATDSHSLAERVRRERISERMRYLQDLVPGCNKITGKAGMLDEIINYVQSLQRQVEFLSMKLAAVNPRLDFTVDSFFNEEMNIACNTGLIQGMNILLPHDQLDPSYIQSNALLHQAQVGPSSSGLDMAMSTTQQMTLQCPMSAPMQLVNTFMDSCYNNVHGSSSLWDQVRLNNTFGAHFSFQSLQGNCLPNNLKTETREI